MLVRHTDVFGSRESLDWPPQAISTIKTFKSHGGFEQDRQWPAAGVTCIRTLGTRVQNSSHSATAESSVLLMNTLTVQALGPLPPPGDQEGKARSYLGLQWTRGQKVSHCHSLPFK